MPLSGPAWVARFPGSKSVDDLVEPFRTHVQSFLRALTSAGAEVEICATFRPPQRAHLMHYSFLVARGELQPSAVASRTDIDIVWMHLDGDGKLDHAASLAAAAAMVAGYQIVFAPVLASRHTDRLAIDMTISWQGDLTIVDQTGLETTISTQPRTGDNRDLHGVGETFGVVKLLTDPPHWSSDGH